MALHLALFSASIASAAVNQQIAAIADPLMAPAGSGLLVNAQASKIVRIIAQGNLLIRAQLNAGSFRELAPFDISPVNVGTIMGSPLRYLDLGQTPISLEPNEELDAYVSNSGAGATYTSVACLMSDGPIRPIQGRVFTLHYTVATALAAHAWAANTPVFDNALPRGTFALVGSRLRSATGLFHRYIMRGGNNLRPGTAMYQAADDGVSSTFDRYGQSGEWMRFDNTTPPQVEAYALAADAAAGVDGYMDLIQVA